MKRLIIAASAAIVALGLTSGAFAATVRTEEGAATVEQRLDDDAYLVGESVTVTAPITGDLFSAGQSVTVTDRVERSIFAAGETVSIKEGVGHNAFLGGRVVTIDGEIGHDVFVGGSTVVIERGARIHGSLHVAGESVTIHGTIDGDVRVGGERVTSDATVGGTLTAEAGQLTFAGGSIGKDLRTSSDTTVINDASVSIQGTREHFETPASQPTGLSGTPTPLGVIGKLLSSLLLGAVVMLLLPKKLSSIAQSVRQSWASNLGIGLASLVGMPIVAGVFFATVVGWPFGLATLLGYAALGIVVWALSIPLAGRLLMRTDDKPWLALLVGALTVAVLGAIPILGSVVKLAFFVGVFLPALGADLRWLWGLVYEPKGTK